MKNTTTSTVPATTTTGNKSETETKTKRMNLRIVPSGRVYQSGNGEYEKLEIRVGEIVLGAILGSSVISGNRGINGASLPEKIKNATGCTNEDAVEAIRVYGEAGRE